MARDECGGLKNDPQSRMPAPEAQRHQHFDRMSQKRLLRIAEHPLRARVDHLDTAGGIDHHHPVRRGFDSLTEPQFQAPIHRRVARDDNKAGEPGDPIADGINNDIRAKAASVLADAPPVPVGSAACPRALEHRRRLAEPAIFLGKEDRDVPADDLFSRVTLAVFGARGPARDLSVHGKRESRQAGDAFVRAPEALLGGDRLGQFNVHGRPVLTLRAELLIDHRNSTARIAQALSSETRT